MLRFFLLFLLFQGLLFFAELLQPVQKWIVMPWTEFIAKLSASIILVMDEGVSTRGNIIQDDEAGFAVEIQPGCNGVEAMIILAAAILAFPAPWRHKLVGFLVGIPAIQVLNLVRIISLFYLGQWSQPVFDFAHLYLWQALIMLDALVVFLIWIRMLPARKVANAA